MPAPFVLVDAGSLDGATAGTAVALPRDAAKHLRTVLRLGPGAELVAADGHGTWAAARLTDDGVEVTEDPTTDDEPRPRIHVLQGLAKGRKVDDVIRTLTELGVDAITPVAADRSVVKLTGDKVDKAAERWSAVARAASEQARRSRAPHIGRPASVAELAPGLADRRLVVAHVGATRPLADALSSELGATDEVVLAVGPEGGWTDAEVDRFAAVGGTAVSLGRSVLRTEHAAPALAAITAYVLGRMV